MSTTSITLALLALLFIAVAIWLIVWKAKKNAPSSGLSTVHEREPLYVPTSEPGLYMVVEQEPEYRRHE